MNQRKRLGCNHILREEDREVSSSFSLVNAVIVLIALCVIVVAVVTPVL